MLVGSKYGMSNEIGIQHHRIVHVVHFLACFNKNQRPDDHQLCWPQWWCWENFCIIVSWISVTFKSFSGVYLVNHYLVMPVLNRMAHLLLQSTFSLHLNSNCLTERTLVSVLRIIPKHFSLTLSPEGKIISYYKKKKKRYFWTTKAHSNEIKTLKGTTETRKKRKIPVSIAKKITS